jgi:hypothetical protein
VRSLLGEVHKRRITAMVSAIPHFGGFTPAIIDGLARLLVLVEVKA